MADRHKVFADHSWDLTAVVRSCSSASDTTTTTTSHVVETSSGSGTSSENPLSFLSTLKFEEDDDPFFFPNLVGEPNNGFEELYDSFKPFFNNYVNNNPTSSNISLQEHQKQQQEPPLSLPTMTTTTTAMAPAATSTTSSSLFVFGDPEIENQQPQQQVAHDLLPLRHIQQSRSSRKRKAPLKRMVCHVTVENLSDDMWAWRKYGQKPIKGSPYPRNYYRCSSSKGCSARKQVERSNADPSIFIVSYTGDHTHPRPTHRNSLAGSSRNKFPRTQNPVADTASPTPPPSAATPVTLTREAAPSEEEKTVAEDFYEGAASAGTADEEVGEDNLLIPNLSAAFNEDPFSGLDELHVHKPASSGSGGSG